MSYRSFFSRKPVPALALLLIGFFPVDRAPAENSLHGTYDFEGKARLSVTSGDLPFGLGSINLNPTADASGVIKLESKRLVVQLEEPIRRREVIRLNRPVRTPKRSSYRYRKTGTTTVRGNTLDYRIVLRLRQTAGKWGGRVRVRTAATSGDLAGSSANVSGQVEQR